MLKSVLIVGILILAVLTVAACVRAAQPERPIPKSLLKTWLHSFEEDEADIAVFRPRDFDFPPAFGRDGFTIVKDGRFVHYDIGPADGVVAIPGVWTLEGENVLCVELRRPSSRGQRYRMEIVSLTEDQLKIRYL